ncbi:MAG: glycosyltransferase family 39 protein [Chloroflexi bacterium]|nr:glycosyltransferase family 39 protein [Chloroflexota bacterium]
MQGESPHVIRLIILAVLLLNTLLLINDLDSFGIWADEGYQIVTSGYTLPEITREAAGDVHPPLSYYVLHVWRQLTGDSFFAMRYLSVLFILLATATVYRIGQDLFNTTTGLLAELFFTTHDLVLVRGREIRLYPQAIFLVALVIWCYWQFYQHPSRGRGIAFVLSSATLIYTHYWLLGWFSADWSGIACTLDVLPALATSEIVWLCIHRNHCTLCPVAAGIIRPRLLNRTGLGIA